MKKSLFRPSITLGITTGPLSVNPYWFHLKGLDVGVLPPNAYGRASSLLLRMNSHAVPCKVLVPLLVMTFTWPMPRPNSAEYTPLCILNSCSASIDGNKM